MKKMGCCFLRCLKPKTSDEENVELEREKPSQNGQKPKEETSIENENAAFDTEPKSELPPRIAIEIQESEPGPTLDSENSPEPEEDASKLPINELSGSQLSIASSVSSHSSVELEKLRTQLISRKLITDSMR